MSPFIALIIVFLISAIVVVSPLICLVYLFKECLEFISYLLPNKKKSNGKSKKINPKAIQKEISNFNNTWDNNDNN